MMAYTMIGYIYIFSEHSDGKGTHPHEAVPHSWRSWWTLGIQFHWALWPQEV